MKRLLCFLFCAVMSFSLAACEKGGEVDLSQENMFRIKTTFYPVYVTTANITDGAADVSLMNLTDNDYGCMHDYTLTSADLKKLAGTNLFIASGMGMESFVGKTSLGIPRLVVLDSGEDIPQILKENNKENPHYWMNIENVISQCDKIKRNIARANPINEDIYEANAARYTETLTALLGEVKTRAEKLRGKRIVVFGDYFDYFADEFGLETKKFSSGHSGRAPAEEEIVEAISYIKEQGVTAVFVPMGEEEGDVIRRIVKETGCKVVPLNLLTEGSENPDVKNAYVDAVRYNLDVIEENIQ